METDVSMHEINLAMDHKLGLETVQERPYLKVYLISNNIQLVCKVFCVKGPTTSQNKDSMLKCILSLPFLCKEFIILVRVPSLNMLFKSLDDDRSWVIVDINLLANENG